MTIQQSPDEGFAPNGTSCGSAFGRDKRTSKRLAALLLGLWSGSLAADCQNWVARLVSAQGLVEVQPSAQGAWQPATAEQRFCPGDKVRTRSQSRASVQLANQTYISLDQRTTVAFSHVEADKPSWIDLLAGIFLARSRTIKSLDVHTPFINAAIKGTEFMVSAGEDKGEVAVFEGEVEASNAAGRVMVSGGQRASAARGEAPRIGLALKPEDAVQWALYFPPLFDAAALRDKAGDPALTEAAKRYAAGRISEALAALDRVPAEKRNVDYTAFRVGLLLTVGRLDEAEPLLAGAAGRQPAVLTAQRAVVALARNRPAEARELAAAAVKADAYSAPAWLAQSYVRQAAFDLPQALEAADKAGELHPNDALIQARRAELLASLNRWAAARQVADRATQLDPRQSRAYVVKGFAELRDGAVAEAEAAFRQAAEFNPADPLARMGLGLAAIRRGDLEGGTADLELAASVNPGNSLIRSYLGKAYYEQKRNAVAEKQFELAEQFDPKDPTPWFYNAVKKHTENRPVEGLHDLQRAIELNDNRAVYRSRETLDSDLAARGAAIGRIYNELGFAPRAAVEAWSALGNDADDYSSHRLLSDAYLGLPRHNLARTSELLQSQLLQPINITPVQPRLAESNLFLVGNLGPSALSLNEFNPLFERDRISLLASGLVGSHGTYGDEAVLSGLWKDWSYSLGQLHYRTDGYRQYDSQKADLYNAFVQGRITPDLSVQAEYRHRTVEYGNLTAYFFPLSETASPYIQALVDHDSRRTDTDTYRLGFNLATSEHGKLLGSFLHMEETVEQQGKAFEFEGNFNPGYTYAQVTRGTQGELQHRYSHEYFNTILGSGFGQVELTTAGSRLLRQEQGYGYFYTNIHYPSAVTWTLGGTGAILDDSSRGRTNRYFDPKIGMLWHITPDTVLRAAAIWSTKRFLYSGQTLEPTQVAGFNQFFDDFNLTRATRLGIGLDQRLSTDLTGGVEISERDLEPLFDTGMGSSTHVHWRETQFRSYLNWTPHPRWAASAEFYRENFTNLELASGGSSSTKNTNTQYIPLSLAYFDPAGWYTRFKATHYYQEVDYGRTGQTGHDSEVFLDINLGYRLPRRLGLLEVQLQNLLDNNYRYEGLLDRIDTSGPGSGLPPYLPFPPEFTVSARLTLSL